MRVKAAFFLVLLISAVSHAQTLPTGLGWHEIPATALMPLCPDTSIYPIGGVLGCRGVTEAWSSAVVDTTRNKLIVWGGGHADYLGNELYAISLQTLTATRLTNPGLPPPTLSPCADSVGNAGQQPVSRHTYDGLAYIAHVDRMFSFGGSKSQCGFQTDQTWLFNFATNSWENPNPVNGTKPSTPGAGFVTTAYDPVTGLVFVTDNAHLSTYNYATNTYKRLSSELSDIDYHLSGALDYQQRIYIALGNGQAWKWNIATGSNYARQTLTLTGCSGLVNQSYPGLAYDAAQGRFVGWGVVSNRQTVWLLNLATNSCTTITPAGIAPVPLANGTYKRFALIPSLNLFVSFNTMDTNLFILRLASPTPPAVPNVPAGLTATP